MSSHGTDLTTLYKSRLLTVVDSTLHSLGVLHKHDDDAIPGSADTCPAGRIAWFNRCDYLIMVGNFPLASEVEYQFFVSKQLYDFVES